jgi:hypothetical protein
MAECVHPPLTPLRMTPPEMDQDKVIWWCLLLQHVWCFGMFPAGPRLFLRFTTNAEVASVTLSQRQRASAYSGDSAWARLTIEHYAIAVREVIWVIGNICGGYGTALHI